MNPNGKFSSLNMKKMFLVRLHVKLKTLGSAFSKLIQLNDLLQTFLLEVRDYSKRDFVSRRKERSRSGSTAACFEQNWSEFETGFLLFLE